MQLTYTTLDVFTTTRYTGNPLAIVHIPSGLNLTQAQKQRIAQEFNLSETVFVYNLDLPNQKSKDVRIEIFTSRVEIPFAGDSTIGVAHYVLRQGAAAGRSIDALITKAGRIRIIKGESSVGAVIPHNMHVHSSRIRSGLSKTGECPIVSTVKGMTFILVPVQDLETLSCMESGLRQDPYRPEHLDPGWAEGFTVTYFFVAQGVDKEGRQVIRTRMYSGDEEDAATGSAASALSCYLALQEPGRMGRGPFEYVVIQGVEMGRESEIGIEVTRSEDGGGIAGVIIQGCAVKVMEGKIEVN